MPWTGAQFAERHNKKLHGAVAAKAASQATAMVRSGVPEGIAIATANKHAAKSKAAGRYAKGGKVKGFAAGGTVDTLGGGTNTDSSTDTTTAADEAALASHRESGGAGGKGGGGTASSGSGGKMDIIGGQGPSLGFSGSGALSGAGKGALGGIMGGPVGAAVGAGIGALAGGIAGGSSLGTSQDPGAQTVSGDVGRGDITALGNVGNASDLGDITSGFAKGGKVKQVSKPEGRYAKGGKVAHHHRRDNSGAPQQPPTGGLAGVAQSPPGGGQGSYPSGSSVSPGAGGAGAGVGTGAAGGGAGGAAGGAGGGGMKRGGEIRHVHGKPVGKDDGLIAAQRGEYVVRKSAVKKLGERALNEINKGRLPSKATDRYRKAS